MVLCYLCIFLRFVVSGEYGWNGGQQCEVRCEVPPAGFTPRESLALPPTHNLMVNASMACSGQQRTLYILQNARVSPAIADIWRS